MILPASRNHTSYDVAPSTGVQRTRPEYSGVSRCGTAVQRMLKPNGVLQRVTPPGVRARTCAYSANGCPFIQGSAIGSATTGVRSALLSCVVDQTRLLSSKVLLVASWKS